MRTLSGGRLIAGFALCAALLVLVVTAALAATGTAVSDPATSRYPTIAAAGHLSVSQIGAVAQTAGFEGEGLVMAIAVAIAESGGDPAATDHDSNGTVDRGLWQINSVHVKYSGSCDYDPACCARAAYEISGRGNNWSAWVTFQRGEEIAYLPEALAFARSG